MQARLLKKLNDEEKVAVRQQIKQSAPVLDRIAKLLQEDLDRSIKGMSARDNFNSGDWSSLMAHYLGEQTALRSILSLLDIEDK